MGAMAMSPPCFTACCADSRRRSCAVVVRFVLPEEEGMKISQKLDVLRMSISESPSCPIRDPIHPADVRSSMTVTNQELMRFQAFIRPESGPRDDVGQLDF